MQGSRRSSRARALFRPHTRAGAGGEEKQFNRTEVGATKKGRRGKRKLKRICARAYICRKLMAVTKMFASVYKFAHVAFQCFPSSTWWLSRTTLALQRTPQRATNATVQRLCYFYSFCPLSLSLQERHRPQRHLPLQHRVPGQRGHGPGKLRGRVHDEPALIVFS